MMTKHEFLEQLRAKVSGLPKADVEERLHFYSEMIDDRVEEGMTEEEAVAEMGNVDALAKQIKADIPFFKKAKEKIKSKQSFKAWEIALLVLGAPIWLSLLVALFAVAFSLYAVLWSVVISAWAAFVALVAAGFGGLLGGIVLLFVGKAFSGIALVAGGIVCGGLSIFLLFACKAMSKAATLLTKKIVMLGKKSLVKKEEM